MGENATTAPADETLEDASLQSGETPPPGTDETPGTTEPPSTNDDSTRKELDRIKAALKRANSEAKGYREKAEELDRLKAERDAATLTETERLKKQLADLQAQHESVTERERKRVINYEVRLAAAKLNFVDPTDANTFLADNSSQLTYDADGTPDNVEDVLRALVKAKPYLTQQQQQSRQASTSGGATNPSRSTSAVAPLSWEVISKMTPAEYDQRRAEIMPWMAKNPIR